MSIVNNIKVRIFNSIGDDENNIWANIFDGFIVTLIILNVIMLIIETFNIPVCLLNLLKIFDVISVIVFSIEYLLRLWKSDLYGNQTSKSKARVKYFFSFSSLIDLLTIIPFYIPFITLVDFRSLRLYDYLGY